MKNTRTKSVSCLSLLLSTLLFCTLAFANPPGSYTQTCKNINLTGETLTASCQRMDGSWKTTKLEFAASCIGIISNVDGNLACTGPTGSFARTCRDTKVIGNKVYSTCQRINRSWVNTESTFSGYQHPLTNCDGKLVDKPACN